MQDLHTERDFFAWLSRISALYGDAMAAWGQQVHDAVAGSAASQQLLDATDAAVDRLVEALVSIGRWHEQPDTPSGGVEVLQTLDSLLGASAELLRDARGRMAQEGVAALSALAPRITELRALEGDVERATQRVRDALEDRYGDPGTST
ncbi:MAG: hypothetical protein ACYDCQ_06400 [Dehalococcoidia bacterium]